MKTHASNKTKKAVLPLIVIMALFTIIMFFSCEEPYEEMGTVIINFGGSARYNAWESGKEPDSRIINSLQYTVTLTGTSTISRNVSPGITSVRMAVPPGTWEISLDVFYDGMLFAAGDAQHPVEIKSGQSIHVPIVMRRSEHTFFVVGSGVEWRDTIIKIATGDAAGGYNNYVITITNDISLPSDFLITSGSFDIIIRGNHTITSGSSGTGPLFTLESGQNITLKDTRLAGRPNSGPIVNISGGIFTMEGSASLSRNNNTATGAGGGVYVGGGTFIMKGGTIGGNQATEGGGVYVSNNGTFIKTGGTIYGNDESINQNIASNPAGIAGHAVYIAPGSLFANGGYRNTTAGPNVNLSTDSTDNWNM